jgi:DNA-binding MarR family transcriptional regulator
MLEQLFGSRTRNKLLTLFLENPDKPFFVRELTREINERIHSVRRELDNLSKFGLLTSKQVDQKRFYQVNKKFVLYGELYELIKKSKLLIEKAVADGVQKLDGLKYLALTGRFVDDDIIQTDVLLVGKITEEELQKFINGLENIYQKEIRYTHLTTHEFNVRKELTDKFLYTVLNGKKIVLVNKI